MRLKRLLSTIEINHSSNKPIYPITFEIDNDNNALIRSVMSTKLGRKDRHSSEFQKGQPDIFHRARDSCTCNSTFSPLQLISCPSINRIKG